MGEIYYRVTFEKQGVFTGVHDLLDYLDDVIDDEFQQDAYYEIQSALGDLEYNLYCPDIKNSDAIFAYTEEGYRRFHFGLERLSEVLTGYDFDKLCIRKVNPAKIVYRDKDQIAFEGEVSIC